MNKSQKAIVKYLEKIYDEIQDMCEEYGEKDENLSDMLTILQSEVESTKNEIEDYEA